MENSDGFSEGMLPQAEDAPPLFPQQGANDLISLPVVGYLRMPKCSARLGQSAMPAAAVPKAAVHKNGEALAAEDEIGAARKRLMPAPAFDTGGA